MTAITSLFVSPSAASSLESFSNSASVPKSEKAFIVGQGHAPIQVKLAKKIILVLPKSPKYFTSCD